MIYLLVGQPRHGKSQFAAKLAHDIHEHQIRVIWKRHPRMSQMLQLNAQKQYCFSHD
jgi:adenosyl cobinamide kinase/adenosyl cobinamide phosphate guanylyltransferase